MSVRATPRFIVPLLLSLASTVAGAACVPVVGTARLVPDASCQIRTDSPQGTPASLFTGECFTTHLTLAGFPAGHGSSGATMEGVVSLVPNAPATYSPLAVPEAGAMMPRQVIQTARSALRIGSGPRSTVIYTTDVVVIQPTLLPNGQMGPKVTTEQILIAGTDKKGAYADVTGHLHLMGTSIGAPATVTGQICTP